ncbi:MAG: hypothetical protein ACFFBD_19325 [Candidatus Hodarchaeota archaeon]
MYAAINLTDILFLDLIISSLSIPGALLPALKAARLDLVEALRKL